MNKNSEGTALTKLRRATTPTYPLFMTSNLTVIGVGTFGSLCTLALFKRILRATNGVIPDTTRWITIDADKDSRDKNSLSQVKGVRFLSTGKDGAGSVINKGYELASKVFPEIRETIQDAATELAEAKDNRFPVNLPASENQTMLVVAGAAGGTSGGTKDLVISAGHLAANHLELSRFDAVMATCASEMPWRDKERSVNRDGRQRIMANYAESAIWRYNQMATLLPIKIPLPDGAYSRLPASTRVNVNLEFDWQSETSKLSTNGQLIRMMAGCLFQRFFTAMGVRRESRQCDDQHTGTTGQMHPLSHEVQV